MKWRKMKGNDPQLFFVLKDADFSFKYFITIKAQNLCRVAKKKSK